MAYAILDGRNICCGLTENTNNLPLITATVANIGQYWNGSAFVAPPYELTGCLLYDRNNTPSGVASFVAPVSGWYYVTLIGGGGGGGGGFVNGGAGGGGGPARGLKNMPLFLNAGDVVDIVIGAGGIGGAAGTNGIVGGVTTVAVNGVIRLAARQGSAGNAGTSSAGGAGSSAAISFSVGSSIAGATATTAVGSASATPASVNKYSPPALREGIDLERTNGGAGAFVSGSGYQGMIELPSSEYQSPYGALKYGGQGGVVWHTHCEWSFCGRSNLGTVATPPNPYAYGFGGSGGATDTSAAYAGANGVGGMVMICF